MLFDGFIKIPSSVTVFGVIQSTYHQYGGLQVITGGTCVALFPEIIEIRVVFDIIPQCLCSITYQVVHVLKGTECQKICVNIILYNLVHHSFPYVASFQSGKEISGLQQGEGSVVMTVISTEPVGDGSLRRNSFQSRMIGGSCHSGIETIITDSPCSYISVIICVVNQPFYGIVCVRSFVYILFIFLTLFVFVERAYLDKYPFTLMPSTYILEDDNISVLYIVFQISPEMTVKSFSVWGTRVRAAVHQDRMLPAVVFRFVDSGVKLDSVTHGNHDFPFCVDFLQFEFDTVRLVFCLGLCPSSRDEKA